MKVQDQPNYKKAEAFDSRLNKRPSTTLVNIYLMFLFSFFPLFLTNQYAAARVDKFWAYSIASIIMLIIVSFFWFSDIPACKREKLTCCTITPLSVTDIAFLVFIGAAVVSTVFSAYPLDSLTGNAGRNNGLFLLLIYFFVYFTITRNYHNKHYVIAVYLVFSSFVALLAVVNFYYIDPLNIFSGYSEAVMKDFGSTIGNKNMIAAFTTIFLPIAVMTFVIAKKLYLRIIAGFAIFFAYTGLLCANSSSGILGLIVIIPVMLIFSARSYRNLKSYMLALFILFSSAKVLRLFSLLMGEHHKGFEFMHEFLIFSPITFIPIGVFGLIYLIMQLTEKHIDPEHYPKKLLITLFTTAAVAVFAAFIYAVLHFSVFDTQADLGSFEKLLRFNDRWGTHRGFMWINGMKEYSKFNIFQLLFGTGPDTFAKVFEPYFGELSQRFGDSMTDCAHNEYINYLVTQGAIGLLSYLAIIISVCVRAVKRAGFNPAVLVFISAVICCAAQAFVNLYQPITTPTFFIFLSISEAMNRQADYLKN